MKPASINDLIIWSVGGEAHFYGKRRACNEHAMMVIAGDTSMFSVLSRRIRHR